MCLKFLDIILDLEVTRERKRENKRECEGKMLTNSEDRSGRMGQMKDETKE